MTTERERFEAWLAQFRELAPLHGPVLWEAWQAAVSRAQPAALAEPSVAPEPVAWTTLIEIDWVKRNAGRAGSFYAVKAGPNDIPLFAHPPRAPLTEQEIAEMATQEEFLLICDGLEELTEIVRATERRLGIGMGTK